MGESNQTGKSAASMGLQQLYNEVQTERRLPRRQIDLTVGLLVGGQYFLAKAREIGEGGVLLEAPVALKEHQAIVLTIRIPGVLKVVLKAQVIYKLDPKEPGSSLQYGAAFGKIDFDVKRQIRNYVAAGSDDIDFKRMGSN
jgi:hypothetical protein